MLLLVWISDVNRVALVGAVFCLLASSGVAPSNFHLAARAVNLACIAVSLPFF